MIDPELDQLSRALITATDRLNSEDFRERQARYLKAEAELATLAEGLEADERAVEAAQAALTAYVAGNYLDTGGVADDSPERELFEPGEPFFGVGDEITPIPTEEDEYATAKANGALS